MSPVRRLLVAALPALLLAAGGCSKGSAPTQEEYVAAGNQVCKDGAQHVDDVYMAQAVAALRELTYPDEELGDDVSVYLERPERWIRVKVVPAYQGIANGLRGIPAPDGDATYLDDLVRDLEERIQTLHRRPGDGRAVIDGDTELRERFASYGLDECPPPLDPEPDYLDPEKVQKALDDQIEAEDAPPEVVNPQGQDG